MAKTAEEKAAAKAEKEAAKEAKQEAKAEAKAEKAAAKAEARAEKDQVVNLKSAQAAELLSYKDALASEGLSKKEINQIIKEEKVANKEELAQAKTTLADPGLQFIGLQQTRPDGTVAKGPIVSKMSTIQEQYQPKISEDIKGALSQYRDLGLSTLSKRGNTEIGFGLDDLVKLELSRDPTTGEYTKTGNLAKTVGRAEQYVNQAFTPEELKAQGVRLKEDKNTPGLYTWKFGGDEKKGYVFFKDNGDGTLSGIGANRTFTDLPSGGPLSGVFKAVPYLPEIAAIGASLIPGGQVFVPEILAIGKGLQTASMGGDFGDVLKSAGTSYLGSTVIPGAIKGIVPANIASIPGVTQGLTGTAMGVLRGQNFGDALMSGLTSGLGQYAGSEIGALTGNQMIGRIGGGLTTAALTGGDVGKALESMAMSEAIKAGIDKFGSPLSGLTSQIENPTARRIAENSLTKIINQEIAGTPSRPSMPIPVPGSIRRQFDGPLTQVSAIPQAGSRTLSQPFTGTLGSGAPLRVASQPMRDPYRGPPRQTGVSQPLQPIRDPYRGPQIQRASSPMVQPIRAAKGGSVPPMRRNVAELIPLNRSGSTMLRGA